MPLEPQTVGRLKVQARHSFFTRKVILPAKDVLTFRETAGWPLIIAAGLALVWANWPGSESYRQFWETHVVFDLHFTVIEESLKHLINATLLPLFFFVIGVEIKYEVMEGALSSRSRAMMPAMMALGGVVLPVAIYLGIQSIAGGQHLKGWGVPIATDIVFALAILKLLGDRMPGEMKLLILAFAAVDDIVGVLVIAIVYTSEFSLSAFIVAAALYAFLWVLRLLSIRAVAVYVITGLVFLFAFYLSSVHTTVAGMLLGLLVGVTPRISRTSFIEQLDKAATELNQLHWQRLQLQEEKSDTKEYAAVKAREDDRLGRIEALLQEGQADSYRWKSSINPWVSYIVLPIFAFANAGIRIRGEMLSDLGSNTVPWAIAAALVLGKPLGIFSFAYLAEKTGLGHKPESLNWHHILGMGMLGGIGFTVALFINELAFSAGSVQEVSKLAILTASIVSGVAGYGYMRWAATRKTSA